MSDDMYDYMDNMLGEKKPIEPSMVEGMKRDRETRSGADSKSSIHPLWKLIDTWGGTMYLKARQLTLWGVEP